MSNLTPGDWKLIPGSRSAHCCFDWSIVVDDPDRPGENSNSIAEVLCGTEADAHVLASAKDLLVALDNLQSRPNDPAAHRMALDVLAKARSEKRFDPSQIKRGWKV